MMPTAAAIGLVLAVILIVNGMEFRDD